MKTRIYLRIAKKGSRIKAKADLKANRAPLNNGYANPYKEYYPTVLVALDIEIPDSEFAASRILLDAKIKETTPCVEIKQVEVENGNKEKSS